MQCEGVDQTLALLISNDTSAECSTVRSLGALCGCPITLENSCSLCPNGNTIAFPDNKLPFLSDLFLGFAPSCQILEAYLASKSEDEAICFVSQSFISDYCGCQAPGTSVHAQPPCSLCPDGELPRSPDRLISMPDFPFQTCRQLEEALSLLLPENSEQCNLLSGAFSIYCGCIAPQDSCSLCRDGSPVPLPDQPMELLKNEFGGLVPTCSVYESYVAGLDDTSHQCSNARLFGSVCGCAPVQDPCTFCPGEAMPEEYLDKLVHELDILFGFKATCGDAETYLQLQIPASSDECILGQQKNFVCGCNDGEWAYLGAKTMQQKVFFAWIPRVSALLSLIVSLPFACVRCLWSFQRLYSIFSPAK